LQAFDGGGVQTNRLTCLAPGRLPQPQAWPSENVNSAVFAEFQIRDYPGRSFRFGVEIGGDENVPNPPVSSPAAGLSAKIDTTPPVIPGMPMIVTARYSRVRCNKAKAVVIRCISASVIALLAATCAQSNTSPSSTQSESIDLRPLQLPVLGAGQPCPVSVGTRGTVPPNQPHIFCGPCSWFGDGPVYLALAWKESPDDFATFSLARVPVENGAHRAKTPWVSVPSYSGPILIRGRALDANSKALLFNVSGPGPQERLKIQPPNAPSPSLWSFWPSSMWVPGAGCYGIQIDTLSRTEIVIFEATEG
jgi:hypothetical protein